MTAQNKIGRSSSQNKTRDIFFLEGAGLHPKTPSQNKKAEILFFDKFDKEGGYDIFDDKGYYKIASILKKKLKGSKVKTVIDMGCGSGAFTARLAAALNKSAVIGLDISTGCIRRAKEDYPEIEFEVGDIENTRFKSSSIDLVCFTGILHHFPDFSRAAKEAARILRPGGHFFSYDPNLYNPAFWLYRSPNSPLSTKIGITENERLLTSKEIKNVFGKHGFEVDMTVISGINVSYIENKKAKTLLLAYNFLDYILGLTPLASVIGAWIIGFGTKRAD